ncbi:MAG TPA: DnaB-like helicase C-terminal domain-containing protein, partial [Cyanophyceae cyanobacterium]
SALNIDRYAHLVVEKYRRRQSIQLGNELVEVSHDLATPLDGSLEAIEDKLYRIKDGRLDNRYQLEDAQQMTAPLWDAIEQGKNAGKPIGWSDLDSLTGGLHKKTITIIGADSHMGKTSFMVGLSRQVLLELAEPVLFFSCEMSKEQLNPRLLSSICEINSSRLTKGNQPGGVEPHEWEKIAQGIQTFSSLPWMVYDEPSPSMTTIRSIVKQAIRRHGALGAVFLDYIQMLNLGGHNRVQELGEITRQLRAIAKDFDFPFFVGSQINREASKRNGKDKRPTKNDLRDSGEIGEAADLVITLFRPGHYAKNPADKLIEIIVDKNRPYGCLGTAKMLVELETCHFMQLDNRYTSTVEEQDEKW